MGDKAKTSIDKLDRPIGDRLLRYIWDDLASLENPRSKGKALKGSRFGDIWCYRRGDYRILASICDERVFVLVVDAGHRKEIYR